MVRVPAPIRNLSADEFLVVGLGTLGYTKPRCSHARTILVSIGGSIIVVVVIPVHPSSSSLLFLDLICFFILQAYAKIKVGSEALASSLVGLDGTHDDDDDDETRRKIPNKPWNSKKSSMRPIVSPNLNFDVKRPNSWWNVRPC
jgi:hypothetical protein